jgi:F0F1-type ATP synthase assembly protein I
MEIMGMAKGDGGDQSGMTLGLYPAVGVLLGLLIGTWLDHKFGWGSKGLITGAVIGLVAGLYLLFKEGMRISKD